MILDLSVYLVTDAGLCGPRGVVETVRAAVDGGVTVVQLRDKASPDDVVLAQVEAVADAVAGRVPLLVNDRLDVVLDARRRGIPVAGVHLGQRDATVVAAREALGPDAVVGLSASTADQLAAVHALPPGTVDYLGVGALHPTATKPDHPAPLGVDGFARLAAATSLPCVAIGGVREVDAATLRAAGAAGIAVVSAVCASADPRAAARRLADRWAGSGPGTDPASGRNTDGARGTAGRAAGPVGDRAVVR